MVVLLSESQLGVLKCLNGVGSRLRGCPWLSLFQLQKHWSGHIRVINHHNVPNWQELSPKLSRWVEERDTFQWIAASQKILFCTGLGAYRGIWKAMPWVHLTETEPLEFSHSNFYLPTGSFKRLGVGNCGIDALPFFSWLFTSPWDGGRGREKGSVVRSVLRVLTLWKDMDFTQ